jgi:hypothetical protein
MGAIDKRGWRGETPAWPLRGRDGRVRQPGGGADLAAAQAARSAEAKDLADLAQAERGRGTGIWPLERWIVRGTMPGPASPHVSAPAPSSAGDRKLRNG